MANKKKSKESSKLFEDIMKASVNEKTKPIVKPKKKKEK